MNQLILGNSSHHFLVFFYSYLTATRMEDIENIEEMDKMSMIFPQYIELCGYGTARYTGETV